MLSVKIPRKSKDSVLLKYGKAVNIIVVLSFIAIK